MTTLYDILITIRDDVKAAHPFFSTGYAFARHQEDMGIVASIGKNMNYVGISDSKGNFFYIRIPDKISSASHRANADCDVAIKESIRCSLVAVVKDANEFALKDSLINTLMKTKVAFIKDQYIDSITIIKEEFKGLAEDVIKKAVARLKNMTLVRIDFDISRIFTTNNCEYEICDKCSLNE